MKKNTLLIHSSIQLSICYLDIQPSIYHTNCFHPKNNTGYKSTHNEAKEKKFTVQNKCCYSLNLSFSHASQLLYTFSCPTSLFYLANSYFRKEKGGYDYKKIAHGILVMELFCVLNVVMIRSTYKYDEIAQD